jgi:hypothetical protein
MADASLLARAADCYLRAGVPLDAVRCYRAAGRHLSAAQILQELGMFTQAAQDYAMAQAHEEASWILAHHLGDIPAARAELAAAEAATGAASASADQTHAAAVARTRKLRRRVIRARCNVVENVAGTETLTILADVIEYLEHEVDTPGGTSIEERAVVVAEAINRPDLVALLFASALRGGWYQAAERWNAWSIRALGMPLILPGTDTAPVATDDDLTVDWAAPRPARN